MPLSRSRERGSASVEAMLAIPAIVLVLLLGVAAGRIVVTTAAVEAAARDAARQASIARTGTEAAAKAQASARQSLRSQGVNCTSVSVQVNTTGFGRPVGGSATVSATVTCTVPLADLAFPGMPGSVVRRAVFTSPLDPYRGRTLGLGRGGMRSG
ncbi:TadE/TadG family type IV pilus assembly protein [Streptosporangium sp. NPDC051022]|uniref:TadE/TadG family type IV pilus assembly protein n=1 Tax=Streptosporangium sp. NPDC051022 TaxID=3155752 RepID=UPI0034158306